MLLGLLAAGACRAAPPETAAARAFVITEPQDLLWGASASAALGDVRLENGQLVAVVGAADRAVGFAATGGNLIDLAPLPDGEDELNQVFLYLDDHFPRQGRYTRVEIVDSGSATRAARVRASGTDTHDPRVAIETEYVLEPEARWLTLISRFTSSASAAKAEYEIGDAIQWGRAEHMAPGHGFELRGQEPELAWVAGIGERTSYAMVPDGPTTLRGPHGSVWSDPIGAVASLAPGKPVSYVRHFVVGRGDTASLAGAIASLRREPTGRLTGRVQAEGGSLEGAVVHVMDRAGKLVGLAKVDPSGWYSIELPPGDYTLEAVAPGREPARPAGGEAVTLAEAGAASVSFTMGPQAAIRWRIEGDDARAQPLKITVLGVDPTPTPMFGPIFRASGSRNVILSPRGYGVAPVGVGRYRVLVSRGPEYELIDQTIDVGQGAQPEIQARLLRSVDTRGFIAADLHQHAVPSFDSGVSLADRALSNAAEGLEVLVSTDHNVLTDFRPVIASAGLGRSLASVIGTEATTHSVGHFNAFPLQIDRADARGGMVDPEGWTPRQIFDSLRKLAVPGVEPFIQVNHPRAGDIGYFDLMHLPPSDRPVDARFAPDFDGLEVLSFGFRKETEAVFNDWIDLLRQGARITATGNSDSHTIYGREVGWPRTMVCADDDSPTHFDSVAFTRALVAGCATVSAGPFLVIKSGDVRMGELARANRGRFDVEVILRAPTWVPVDRLRVYVDGVTTHDLPITGSEVARYRRTLSLSCSRDCFVIARADSERPLPEVVPSFDGRDPFSMAITNPIYVDADGDGRYEKGRN